MPPNPRSRPPRRRRTGIAPVGLFLPEVSGRPPRPAALKKQILGGSAPEPPPPSATPADRHRSGWAVSSGGVGAPAPSGRSQETDLRGLCPRTPAPALRDAGRPASLRLGCFFRRCRGARPVRPLSRNRSSGALPPNPRSRPPRRRQTGIAPVRSVSSRGVGRTPVRLLPRNTGPRDRTERRRKHHFFSGDPRAGSSRRILKIFMGMARVDHPGSSSHGG